MRRVQISFDFLAIVIFAFIIFLELFEVYAVESSSARIREGMVSAVRIASSVTRTINEVCKENGTSALITIPESLDTSDTYYLSITASGRRVDVFWPVSSQNRSISVPILTSNITVFNISKTVNSGSSNINVSNINGSISMVVS